MPRVNYVKAAAKDNPVAKKGESYYWWKPRYGAKRYSKMQPRPSQTTTSDFLSRQMELEERLGDLRGYSTFEELKSDIEEIISEIRMLGEEQADKLSNMPDSLQQGPTGELLEGRSSGCEDWAGELEGVDLDVDEPTEQDAIDDLDPYPTLDNIKDSLNEGDDEDAVLQERIGEWEEEKDAKLEELQAEYQDQLTNAIDELQGCSYQGE